MVEDSDKALQDVGLLVMDDTRFVVAIAHQKDDVGIRLEPLHGCINDGVQVPSIVVFGANVLLAPAWISLPLHTA
jgi:hypothetical protein